MADVKDYPPYLDYPKEQKKQTNADKIRQMTDEELAELLEGEYGNMLPNTALSWLKQEVESDGKAKTVPALRRKSGI